MSDGRCPLGDRPRGPNSRGIGGVEPDHGFQIAPFEGAQINFEEFAYCVPGVLWWDRGELRLRHSPSCRNPIRAALIRLGKIKGCAEPRSMSRSIRLVRKADG